MIINTTRVMYHDSRGHGTDAGTAECWFGANLTRIVIGKLQEYDDLRGAWAWWPLTLGGELCGELRDDASGMTIHVQDCEAKIGDRV